MIAGRITSYVAIGGAVAGIGVGIVPAAASAHTPLIQWAGAASLMWMGLLVAGMAPHLGVVDRGQRLVEAGCRRLVAPLSRHPWGAPFALGLVWGINPCPMIYSAAIFASVTGSITTGMAFMAAFGLGTIPAVVAAAAGMTTLRQLAVRSSVRVPADLAIAVAGLLLARLPMPALLGLCAP